MHVERYVTLLFNVNTLSCPIQPVGDQRANWAGEESQFVWIGIHRKPRPVIRKLRGPIAWWGLRSSHSMSERAHESSNHSNQAWNLDHSLETVTDSKLGMYLWVKVLEGPKVGGKGPTPITDFAVMSNVTYNLNSKCSICVFAFNNKINILISLRG